MTPPRVRQGAAFLFLALLTLALSGCNVAQSGSPSGSGGGNTPSAHVGLNVSSLDFGSVAVNSSKSMHITLTNSTASGGPSVTVSAATASGTGFSANNTLPVDLAPGQSTDLTVIFKPTAAGGASGTLSIDVVGASDPANVPLTGNGTSSAGAQLTVSPSTLSFGTVNVGSTKNMSGTLSAANSNVTVSSAGWTGSGYSVSGITFPVTVQSGKSVSFTVTFAPQAAGSSNGSISFASNANNSPANQSLTGTGAAVAQQHTVNLSWAASSSSVSGYNVYRGSQSGGPYSRLNSSLRTSTSYSDSSVQSGAVYYYVATAVDSSSTESAFSDEVAAVIPTP